VDYAVGGLPFNEPSNGTDAPWDYLPLVRMKQRYESGGFKLAVIEARPPLNNAKRGLPGRDEEIATVCTLIENMGRLGIPVWCYEWMTDFNWMRTSTSTLSRGGSVVTSYDNALMQGAPPTEIGHRKTLGDARIFSQKVLPVAEKWNLKLAVHLMALLSPITGWDVSC
jgi:mannonate dehydratase